MTENKIIFSEKLIIVTGYTATGKTKLAVQLAHHFNGEIISADSRQVYKGLDIGTGKDLDDYCMGGNIIKYHLIDICDAKDQFSLFDFKQKAIKAMCDIFSRGKVIILCGGSPLYIDSIIKNYQFVGEVINPIFEQKFVNYSYRELIEFFKNYYPNKVNDFDLSQKRRIIRAIEIIESGGEFKSIPSFKGKLLVLAPFYERKVIYQRIEERLRQRWENLIMEVEFLKNSKILSSKRLKELGLEYRYINELLELGLETEQCFNSLCQAIRKFAKRQGTWFRKLEKSKVNINWLNNFEEAKKLVVDFLA